MVFVSIKSVHYFKILPGMGGEISKMKNSDRDIDKHINAYENLQILKIQKKN